MNNRLLTGRSSATLNGRVWVLAVAKLPGRPRPRCRHWCPVR